MTEEELKKELSDAQNRLEFLKQEIMKTLGVIDFINHCLKKPDEGEVPDVAQS